MKKNYLIILSLVFIGIKLTAQPSFSSITMPTGLSSATIGNATTRVVTADFDNDGDIDLLSQLGGGGTQVTYHSNNGNSTFTTITGTAANPSVFSSGPFNGLSFVDIQNTKTFPGDYDNDGDIDIFETSSTSTRFLQNSGGTFTSASILSGMPSAIAGGFARFVPADYNNDGDLDFLYQTTSGTANMFYCDNNGAGNFTSHAANASGMFSSGIFNGVTFNANILASVITVSDFDNDGDLDVYHWQSGGTNYYKNNSGAFVNAAVPTGLPTTLSQFRILPADFDSDGDVDVLYQTGSTVNQNVFLAVNDGTGAFSTFSANSSGVFGSGFFNGLSFYDIFATTNFPFDFDQDGDLDLYQFTTPLGGSGPVIFYRCNGVAPTLSSRTPANGATGVSIATSLTMTFSENMFAGSSNNNIYIKRYSDDTIIQTITSNSGSVSGSGTTSITVSLSTLSPSTKYYVSFNDQVFKDNEGVIFGFYDHKVKERRAYTSKTFWSFTTAASPLISGISGVNILCNGSCTGSATVTPSGGMGSYIYNWVPSGGTEATASSLCVGNYTCTITDAASATITKTIEITQPAALSLTPSSQNNISCNGGNNGTASMNAATGGAAGYAYNWTPGNPTGDGTISVSGLIAGTWTCTVTDANSCTATQTVNITAPTALALTAGTQTNISCFNGSNGAATMNAATGGTIGYAYNWTPGNPTGDGTVSVSGLTAGTWTCTVTDANSCTATQTVTITAPAVLSLTAASQNNISCNGGNNGTASMNAATGGAAGYAYNWTPGNPTGDGTVSVSGLTAGTWTCTVTDANSCTATQTITITAPAAITGSFSHTACDSYVWNSQTYHSGGDYNQTLTAANGCDSTVTLHLTINKSSTGDTTAIACESFTWYGTTYTTSGTPTHVFTNAVECDSTITLHLTINKSSTGDTTAVACESFTWYDTTYTSSGIPTHVFTNAVGCDSVVTLHLTIHTLDNTITQNNQTLTANTSGASYQWIDCNNGNTPVDTEIGQSFTTEKNGSYAVIITQNGCTDTSDCKTIITTGIGNNIAGINPMVAYPNPSSGHFTLKIGSSVQIIISNVLGEVILNETLQQGKHLLNLGMQPSGVYYIKSTADNGELQMTKIVIE